MENPGGSYPRQPRIAFRPVSLPQAGAKARSSSARAIDLLCFAIPFANLFSIDLIGALPGGEFLTLAVIIPCVVVAWKRIWRGYNKTILMLMGLWFLSQLVTDFYRHSPLGLMARGLAAISFFAIDLIVISALAYKRPRRIVLLILGQITCNTLYYYLFSRPYLDTGTGDGPWKFGTSTFVIPAVILGSCYFYHKRQYWITFLMLLAIAGENLLKNYRSEMLIIMASSMLIIPLSFFEGRKNRPTTWGRSGLPPYSSGQKTKFPMRIVILFLLVAMAGVGAAKTYSYLAERGTLGDEAQEKYRSQSRGKFGLLIGGRPESLVSFRAVLDSPLIGHGSWAEDRKYSEMLTDIVEEAGYVDEDTSHGDTTSGNYSIPCHSYLMSAWVWAGVLGAVFWFYILYLNGKATLKLATEQPPLAPYFAYLMVGEFWRVLFSPFGYTVRMDQAIVIVTICSLIEATSVQSASRKAQLTAVTSRFLRPLGILP